MELGKYIRAMRPKKYLTREFKVYDESIDPVDNTNTIDTMPTKNPSMDNVMPYTDGLVDPRYRQLELADGGIVQREGFKDGINYNRNPEGSNQYKTKTLEEVKQIIEANPDLTAKDLEGYGKKTKGRLLSRDDLRRAKEAGIEPGKKGKHIDPEKERARDRLRRESIKSKSSPAMEQAIGGTKEKNLSHAGRKNTPVSLENLMYTDASLNIRMLHPFEKPLEEAMTKFEKVYNSDASPEVKRKAAFELQKFDRELRKKYPEYAKLKTRFQFKNSAFEPGFVFKEKLPNPSLAISNEPGTFLQGINPKSKKGQQLIQLGQNKLETLINNIGLEKIKAGKINNNEFNVLQKTVKNPAVQAAIKYGGKTLKILGAITAPLIAYDTYTAYKEGKPTFEILEEGLLGTGLARGIREAQTYTPEEQEAIAQKKQYAREEEDYSGLSSDFNIPSNLSADQIDLLSVTGPKRVEEKLAAEDAARAAERVYEGDPGFISETGYYAVGGRVGFK